MAPRLSAPPRRVFVIGPMSDHVPDEQGMVLGQHIPNIIAAAREAIAELAATDGDFPACDVQGPVSRSGDIVDQVFDQIIHCDLAIADISNRSPNVFYELALLHANGVPVILFTRREDDNSNRNTFYLLQQNVLGVTDFETDTLRAALLAGDDGGPGQLEALITQPSKSQRNNPITKYFKGVSLVNVAAATGVATGYYINFVQWVLRTGFIFRSFPDCTHLVIVRPARLGSLDQDIGRLEAAFGAGSGTPLERLEYPHQGHPRDGYNIRRIGPVFVDYPAPISSLTASRQYDRMKDFLKDRDDTAGLRREEFERELTALEQRIIDAFFGTLDDLAYNAVENVDYGRLRWMTVDDIIAEFGG